jgi:hypothetical protein
MDTSGIILVVLTIFLFLLAVYASAAAYYINDFYLNIMEQDPTLEIQIYDRPMFYLYVFSVIAAILCSGIAAALMVFMIMKEQAKKAFTEKMGSMPLHRDMPPMTSPRDEYLLPSTRPYAMSGRDTDPSLGQSAPKEFSSEMPPLG